MKKFSTIFLLTGLYFSAQVQGQTTYNDVASIFYKHCTVCHHTGGVAPMPLMTYNETSVFSTSISNAVQDKYGILMPPYHPDTAYVTSGHKGARFLQENILTAVEKGLILAWINGGTPEGPALTNTAPGYGYMPYQLNGIADLTLQILPFHSNAKPGNSTQQNPYNCFAIPTNLTEDRWLRAYEIIPGNLAITHHIIVNVDTMGGTVASLTDTSGGCGTAGGQLMLGGWVPGGAPAVFPNDPSFKVGVRIPKGSTFAFNVHYAPGSDGKLDPGAKIRLFFYPVGSTTGIRPVHIDAMLQQWDLFSQFTGTPSIPKNTIKTWTGVSTNPGQPHTAQPSTAMTLLSAGGHSHNVCQSIKIYASLNNDTIPVLNIKDWNFNWQGNYSYPKPLKIPAGYILKSEHVYNNTVTNPHLTGPPIDVNFAQPTTSEMLFDSFAWLDYQTNDELIDVKALLANDALLQVGINEVAASSGIQSFIYPNPASDNVNIYVSGKSVYKGCIFNITGQTILNTETFNNNITVDVKNIPAGLYIVEIVDIKTNDRITKKIIISNQ